MIVQNVGFNRPFVIEAIAGTLAKRAKSRVDSMDKRGRVAFMNSPG